MTAKELLRRLQLMEKWFRREAADVRGTPDGGQFWLDRAKTVACALDYVRKNEKEKRRPKA